MAQISAATGASFGPTTPFFVPPTFLYKQKAGVTPHVCQIVALSQITGYRFADWMTVCGFDPELIFSLQLALHDDRTVLVVPGHAGLSPRLPAPSPHYGSGDPGKRYLYAKIGRSDAVVYPAIFPGSVVRADPSCSPGPQHANADAYWLVEHLGGLACCRIQKVDEKHIILLPNHDSLPRWPLRLTREARVLGLVDLELRPPTAPKLVPRPRPSFAHRPMLPRGRGGMSFSRMIRSFRSLAGLTLRDAHELTVAIARSLGNTDYGISLGQLSDYEASNKPPRHIAKIMSLCAIYCMDLLDLMATIGVRVDDSETAPLRFSDAEAELTSPARPEHSTPHFAA